MPKMKTHKGAKTRFHVTGSGKIMRMKGHRSHLRRKKPDRVHRLFHHKIAVSHSDEARIKRLMPYM